MGLALDFSGGIGRRMEELPCPFAAVPLWPTYLTGQLVARLSRQASASLR
jgi:hypothetical protein